MFLPAPKPSKRICPALLSEPVSTSTLVIQTLWRPCVTSRFTTSERRSSLRVQTMRDEAISPIVLLRLSNSAFSFESCSAYFARGINPSSWSCAMLTRASRSDFTLIQRKPAKPAEPNETTDTMKSSASALGLVRVLRRSSSGSRLIWIIGARSSEARSGGESRRHAQCRRALEQRLVVEPLVVEVEALDRVPGHGSTLEDALEGVLEARDARTATRHEDLLDLAVGLVLVVVEAQLDLVAEVLEARQHRLGDLRLAAAGLALELLALER